VVRVFVVAAALILPMACSTERTGIWTSSDLGLTFDVRGGLTGPGQKYDYAAGMRSLVTRTVTGEFTKSVSLSSNQTAEIALKVSDLRETALAQEAVDAEDFAIAVHHSDGTSSVYLDNWNIGYPNPAAAEQSDAYINWSDLSSLQAFLEQVLAEGP
jgi:hypothetical protein